MRKPNLLCLYVQGFRKTVPDKWEFANENFKRGEKDLLSQIRRRKSAKPVANDNLTSPASSSDDPGSSFTSSPDSKNPGSMETQVSTQLAADLSGENEKLRRDNQVLSCELAQTKKQCDELVAFLTRCVKVAPDQISRIMDLGAEAASGIGGGDSDSDDDENDNCMKLFGVVLKKKRGCSENSDFSGPHKKEMKRSVEVNVPWMKISASPGETSKVCN